MSECAASRLDKMAFRSNNAPGHWITSCVYDGSVYVFDSLLTNNSSIDDQLCMVYHHFAPDCPLVVRTVNCQQQDNDKICGVMAIAFAVEIAIHGLFAAIMAQFDLPQMRQWLATCLEAKKLDPFPQQSSLAPMPQSMWMERTLIVPSPPSCHILLLAESRQQPGLQAENGALDIPPSEVFNEEMEKTAYKPLGQQKKMQLIDDDDDDPELIDAEPNKQLYLLTQQANMDVSIAHFSVQDMFDRLPKETDLELYKMKRVEDKVWQLMEQNDQSVERSLHSILSNCHSTAQYWSKQTGHLMVMDANASPATFFVTLSCKEYKWPDVREVLELLNQDIPDVMTKRQGFLCTKDPMTVSNQFYDHFMMLMREVIMNEYGPFGEVLYFFWRIEYQARGAPHVHMKLWIKDAPIVGEALDDDMLKFITKCVTCRLPSPISSPDLYRLVVENQVHSCHSYCKRCDRLLRMGWHCRFGFPHPVLFASKLNPLERALRWKHGRVDKLYRLECTVKESMINDYNALILYIWQSNIDVQFIGETTMLINRHITKYTTQGKKQKMADLWSLVDKSKSPRSQLLSLIL